MANIGGRPNSTNIRALVACFLVVIGGLTIFTLRSNILILSPTITPTTQEFSSATSIFISTTAANLAISPRADELKQKWLSGNPCPPPCWEGITPGKTSAIEAGKILSANPMFTRVEVEKSPFDFDNTGFVSYEWEVKTGATSLSHRYGDALFDYASSDQVIHVIRPAFPTAQLDEIIRAFGDPNYIVAYGEPPVDIGGPYTWSISIVWLSKGFAAQSGGGAEPTINANLPIDGVLYFAPTLDGYGLATNDYWRNHLKPWQGYGNFEKYSSTTTTP